MNFQEKSVLAVTILLRKVARCILGTRNWVLTLLRRQRKKKHFLDQLWEAGLFVFKVLMHGYPINHYEHFEHLLAKLWVFETR
jgi:hypothetical protein